MDDWLFENCEHEGLKAAVAAAWERLPEHARGVIRELHPIIEAHDGLIKTRTGPAHGLAQCFTSVENPAGPVTGYRILIDTQLSPDGLVYAVAHEMAHLYLYHPRLKRARPGATMLDSFAEQAAIFLVTEVFNFLPEYQIFHAR